MKNTALLLSLMTLLSGLPPAIHAQTAEAPESGDSAVAADPRQLVTMPAEARELMRTDMLDHLAALNSIIGLLAENDLQSVAEVAETRMGKSSMGKHRASGMGPGRFMTLEMRNIGWGMHEAASELAQAAEKNDSKGAWSALQRVTGACVACHNSYRTR